MALKRQPLWGKFFTQLKRLWIDLTILAVMFGLTFFLPATEEEAKRAGSQLNLMALGITKTIGVLWPLVFVDIMRRWKWPYLDLQCLIMGKDIQGNEIKYAQAGIFFLGAIYVVVIYSFAKGG